MLQTYESVPVNKRRSWLEHSRAQRVIFINQRMVFWLFHLTSFIWRRSFKNELTEESMIHGSRYVLACNHQSIVDPFFICSQLPYRVWRHLGTLNYFTANMYIDFPLYRGWLVRLGSFPAKPHIKHPYGLEYSKRVLAKGGTILIFPEGRRSLKGESRIRHGVEVLGHEPNVMIIPARIEWSKTRPWRTFKLGMGKPFDASRMTSDEIMDRVYAQPVE